MPLNSNIKLDQMQYDILLYSKKGLSRKELCVVLKKNLSFIKRQITIIIEVFGTTNMKEAVAAADEEDYFLTADKIIAMCQSKILCSGCFIHEILKLGEPHGSFP